MQNPGSETENTIIETAGAILSDGTAIELVSPASGDTPQLLKWNGEKAVIAPQVEHAGKSFRPPSLPASIFRATRLPTGVVDFGTPEELMADTRCLFETHLGCSTGEAALLTAWSVSTWFSDLLPSPCTLFLHGFDMDQAIGLFRLLACTGRHPLLLTEITRPALASLMALRPTLLLNQPRMPSRLLDLVCAANYRGLVVPGSRGAVIDLVGSRAIFLGMDGASYTGRNQGLHVGVPPARRDFLPLDETAQRRTAEHFQPRLLMYRLLRSQEVRQSRFDVNGSTSQTSGLGRTLEACVPDSGEFRAQWLPLLQLQEQAALAERLCDPCAAVIEVMWPRLHANEKGVSTKELTEFTNTLLCTRGEHREYSCEEIGKKMQSLGLHRHRRGPGMVVVFDRDTSRRMHMLAGSFGVCKAVAGCPECEATQIIAQQEIVQGV